MRRPKRPRTDYKALPLLRMAREYIAGASLRELAEAHECNDHKPLGRHLTRYVQALGGQMRTQAESQAVRRDQEQANSPPARWNQERVNTPGDVLGWHDFAFYRGRR